MVCDRAELLGLRDDAIRQIRMKLIGKGQKSLLVGRREITKPAYQAHQQRAVFNCDHIASARELRRGTGDKYDRFSGEGLGFAEVGGAVSGVQADLSFSRRRKSNRRKPLPGAVTASRGVDNQLSLNQSCVGAADTANAPVAIDQFSNRRPALKPNIRDRRCSRANHKFNQAATGTICLQSCIKRCSHRKLYALPSGRYQTMSRPTLICVAPRCVRSSVNAGYSNDRTCRPPCSSAWR